jgi:hypothetical protein
METLPLSLTIERTWSAHAERFVRAAEDCAPAWAGSTEHIRAQVECGAAELLVFRLQGHPVLVVAIKRDADTVFVLAAAGRLPGVDLTAQIMPVIERLPGADVVRLQTARPGLVRKLERQGFRSTVVIMEKRRAAA